ncbi:hypothetical protein [uncultured Tateyamaria sp.]|uniref:hypothetical protein n=1 Tax=uncultured Tateyamaria sp. TaxID=455651 RepID=UPI0026365CC9|nr:hypothetical protein [uncultured Tateyamaria sp.]
MNAHASTFGKQQETPEVPAEIFQILNNMYDTSDQLTLVPRENFVPLLDCKLHEKLRDASDRKDHFAMMEMRMIIETAVAKAGYGFCSFETGAAVSVLFEPEKFIDLYDLLEADQAVEGDEGLNAFIWRSGQWAQLQFVLAAIHYKSNPDTLGRFVSSAWKTGKGQSIMTANFDFKTCSELFEASSQRGLNMEESAPTKAISKTLYRGGALCPSLSHGMSWTEDRDMAVFFAKRLNKETPIVLSTKTSANRVLARFEHESEAVLSYDTKRPVQVEFL